MKNENSMEEQLMRMEEKLDMLIREVEGLKMRQHSNCHLPRDKPLPIKQAANYLHLSVSRIYSLVYQKKLNPIQRKRNSKLLFSIGELDSYLNAEGKVECVTSTQMNNQVNN
jgi:hypothetical protein